MADAALNGPPGWTRRPHFSPSQMLTAEHLNALADDQQRRLETLMRALHGRGAIFGLAVTAAQGGQRLDVSCGMALDRHGRLLHWPGGSIGLADIVDMPKNPGLYTLFVHHARSEPPGGGCGPCADRPGWIEEGVAFTLAPGCVPLPRPCPPLPDADGVDRCISLEDYVCLRNGSEGAADAPADLEWACRPPGELTRIGCEDRLYDKAAGIPIACVTLGNIIRPGGAACFGFVEAGQGCEMRPHVYRTPLLYDLIRDCHLDLPRVASLSWLSWTIGCQTGAGKIGWSYKVPWDALKARLDNPEGWIIGFSKPLDVLTLHPGSIFLTYVHRGEFADYREVERIAAGVVPLGVAGGFASRCKLTINSGWKNNDFAYGGRLELTVRGQMLRDRCGNMLDARPLDDEPGSPVRHRPGGDFVAVFRFSPGTAIEQDFEE